MFFFNYPNLRYNGDHHVKLIKTQGSFLIRMINSSLTYHFYINPVDSWVVYYYLKIIFFQVVKYEFFSDKIWNCIIQSECHSLVIHSFRYQIYLLALI